jgi:phage shock protein PspC (stress-responsive transcriptional regulator)
MASFQIDQPLRLVSRSRSERWVGGVCGGVGRARRIHPAWIRAAFVIGGLIAGVAFARLCGLLADIPAEGEEPGVHSSGWLVALAKACATCLAGPCCASSS